MRSKTESVTTRQIDVIQSAACYFVKSSQHNNSDSLLILFLKHNDKQADKLTFTLVHIL